MNAGGTYSVRCPQGVHGNQQVMGMKQEGGQPILFELACGCRCQGTDISTNVTTNLKTGVVGRPWDGVHQYTDYIPA